MDRIRLVVLVVVLGLGLLLVPLLLLTSAPPSGAYAAGLSMAEPSLLQPTPTPPPPSQPTPIPSPLDNLAQSAPPAERSPGLFTTSAIKGDVVMAGDPTVARTRFVNVHFDLLGKLDAPAERVVLNLFDDAVFTAVFERTETNYLGSFVWAGHLEGVEYSDAILVVTDGLLAANISMPGGIYEVHYAGKGVHAIHQIDQSAFPPEMEPIPAGPRKDPPTGAPGAPRLLTDNCNEITVGVAYSPEARSLDGGTAAIQNRIALAVAESNQSYINSGINNRLFLVFTVETLPGDAQNSFSPDLAALEDLVDGIFDNVDALRDSEFADVVSLIITDTTYCGLGKMNSTATTAFSVVERTCATGYYSFAHEIGHNEGALHDWYIDDSTSPGYNKGYIYIPSRWRTIMAYDDLCDDTAPGTDCTRIQYWSNPTVSYLGNPTGVTIGTAITCTAGITTTPHPSTCDADNRTQLNNTCSTVANFRSPPHFHVNSTADTSDGDVGDGICDTGSAGSGWTGTCTLRAAIEEANASAVTDTIKFDIPLADTNCNNTTGVCTITPGSALPVISDSVTIDGYTQPGASVASSNAVLKIVLDGSQAGNGVDGLVIATNESTIRGLNIHSFRVTKIDHPNQDFDFTHGNGIVIREGTGNTITGNFIGTNVDGDGCVGNGGSGVLIGGPNSTGDANNNTVGGTSAADRNIITCNGFQDQTATGWDGVSIRANHVATFYSADGNTVIGNYIGTDVTGMMTLTAGTDISGTIHIGNTGNGVRISGGLSNTVGSTDPYSNTISGNELAGVRIEAIAFDYPPTLTRAANNNAVQGNYIGTDVNGSGDLGNLDVGVYIVGLVDDADNNIVGGTTGTTPGGDCTGACNLISGNGGDGVMILGGQADHNTVQGNYIGTDVNGDPPIPNDGGGINITDAEDNDIGGTTDTARNLVSGNGGHGISIVNNPKSWHPIPDPGAFRGSGDASGNTIEGNYVGTDVGGTLAISNTLNGVLIMGAADNVVEDNLISGNGENGILIMAAGTPGNVETDVVTAEGTSGNGDETHGAMLTAEGTSNGNPVSGSDSATVTITDQPSALQVTKTVTPTTVAAAGDVVTFTIGITNTSGLDVAIKRLSDSIHGNLNSRGTCAVPQILANSGFYTCTFSAAVFGFGPGGNSETDTVTASGTDANGNFVINSDSATVNIVASPSIRVTKTANPTNLTPPGGTVNFTVTVKNISISESVTITKTWDTKHGILCGIPPTAVGLGPGDTLNCYFSATVSGATGNTVEGNFIGTDYTGTISVPNQLAGIQITDAPDNAIGASGNLISGNAREGVVLLGAGATGNSLRHNLIGTQANGTSDLGNGSHGVFIAADASDNAIGLSAGVSNTIAHNGGDGVLVYSGTGNQILSNSIFDNDELGIDLGDDNAVTPNDDTDPDAGGNNLQNYPVLTSASSGGGTIGGVLNSTPSTQFTLEFFHSPTCDPSGFGEGQTLLVSAGGVQTDSDGDVFFTVVGAAVPDGNFITATATDPDGNTSEFSNCLPVPSAPALGINKEVQDLNGGDALPGDTLLYTITYSNTGNAPATGVFIEDTYSVSCTTISNVTNGDFSDHNDNGTRLRWPATGGILLNAQASGSVSYRCTLPASFPPGTTDVTNTSTIDSDQTDFSCAGETPPEEDPTDGCDQEEVSVTVSLTIDKEVQDLNGGSAQPGDTLRYTIDYTNPGNAAATGVFITDTYSISCTTISNVMTDTNFSTSSDIDGVLRWPQGQDTTTLAAGASGSLSYDCLLQASFPDGITGVTNTSTIDSDQTDPDCTGETPSEEDPTDGCDQEEVAVTAAAVLTIDKAAQDPNGGNAEPGDTLQYTINYANTGDAPATGVFITDDYSDLCATISSVTDGDFPDHNDNGDRLRWPNAGGITLAAQASGSVSYDCALQADPFPAGTTQVINTSTIDSNETGPEQDTETLSTVDCYDFNGNGVVDVGDIMEVAVRWQLTPSDPNWDDKYDVDEDGVITVLDIMSVAAQWGWIC